MRLDLLTEESKQFVVPVIYNYDSVLVGMDGEKWCFPDARLKGDETFEEAAIRAADEIGLVIETIKTPFSIDDRNNVTFIFCSYRDGKPRLTGKWHEWRWLPPDQAIALKEIYGPDKDLLRRAKYILGSPEHKIQQ